MKKSLGLVVIVCAMLFPTPIMAQSDTTTRWFSEDGRFMVMLPEDWSAAVQVSGEMEQLQIANHLDMAETDGPAFESGDRLLAVMPYPRLDQPFGDGSLEFSFSMFIDITLADYLESLGVTQTSEIKISNGMATVYASIPQFDLVIRASKYLAPGVFGIYTLAAPTGELNREAEAELWEVALTVQYSPERPERYRGNNASFQFYYPEGWEVIFEEFGEFPVIMIGQEVDLSLDSDDVERWAIVVAAFPPAAMAELDFSTDEAMIDRIQNIGSGFANSFSEDPTFEEVEFLTLPFVEDITIISMPFTSDSAEGGALLFYDGTQGWVGFYAGPSEIGRTSLLLCIHTALSLQYIPERAR